MGSAWEVNVVGLPVGAVGTTGQTHSCDDVISGGNRVLLSQAGAGHDIIIIIIF